MDICSGQSSVLADTQVTWFMFVFKFKFSDTQKLCKLNQNRNNPNYERHTLVSTFDTYDLKCYYKCL